MHSTDIHQIKAAIADQAFIGSPFVCCPMGRVVAIRKRKGQLLAMIRGWGARWYPIECVTIETRRSRWRTSYRISDSSKRGEHYGVTRLTGAEHTLSDRYSPQAASATYVKGS